MFRTRMTSECFRNISRAFYHVHASCLDSEHPDTQPRTSPPKCAPWTQSCIRYPGLGSLGDITVPPSYGDPRKPPTSHSNLFERVARDTLGRLRSPWPVLESSHNSGEVVE
ncbi:hypothetical protein AAC387_Pa07g1766 [Persea americana]